MFITSILLFVEDVAENVTERVAKKLTERPKLPGFRLQSTKRFCRRDTFLLLLRRCVVFLLIRELS